MPEILSRTRQLTMQEAELPLAYTVPFEWGGLHVTDSANDAYNFIPLTPDTISGGDVQAGGIRGKKPRVDVFVVGPDEYGHAAEYKPTSKIELYKKGIALAMGFPLSTDVISERTRASLFQMSQLAEDLPEYPFSILFNNFGLPESEEIVQDTRQLMIHQLANLADISLENSTMLWNQKNHESRSYRQILAAGSAAIFGWAGWVLPELGMGDHSIGGVEAGFGSAWLIGGAAITRSLLSEYFLGRDRALRPLHLSAKMLTASVSDSIHEAFCSRHFNEQTERLLSTD